MPITYEINYPPQYPSDYSPGVAIYQNGKYDVPYYAIVRNNAFNFNKPDGYYPTMPKCPCNECGHDDIKCIECGSKQTNACSEPDRVVVFCHRCGESFETGDLVERDKPW